MKATTSTITALLFSMTLLLTACAGPSGGNLSVGRGDPQAPPQPSHPESSEKIGPPSHAPAHGYRAKHAYRYYPNERTYYDPHRQLYFFLDGDGWRIAVSLPSHIKLSNDFVTVELDTDKPYEHYDEHAAKFPPGQMKKWEKKKGSKWATK